LSYDKNKNDVEPSEEDYKKEIADLKTKLHAAVIFKEESDKSLAYIRKQKHCLEAGLKDQEILQLKHQIKTLEASMVVEKMENNTSLPTNNQEEIKDHILSGDWSHNAPQRD